MGKITFKFDQAKHTALQFDIPDEKLNELLTSVSDVKVILSNESVSKTTTSHRPKKNSKVNYENVKSIITNATNYKHSTLLIMQEILGYSTLSIMREKLGEPIQLNRNKNMYATIMNYSKQIRKEIESQENVTWTTTTEKGMKFHTCT